MTKYTECLGRKGSKLPARVAAHQAPPVSELSSFTEPAWFRRTLLTWRLPIRGNAPHRDRRRSFVDGEYLFWLFGNDRIRLALIPDPCYQTEYGGANGFLLYRNGGRVSVTQVLDGFFSRADNPISLAFARLNGEQIIEVSSWSGGLNPSLTNYYFTIDPKTNHAVPKNLFKGDHGPTNEISSALLFDVSATVGDL